MEVDDVRLTAEHYTSCLGVYATEAEARVLLDAVATFEGVGSLRCVYDGSTARWRVLQYCMLLQRQPLVGGAGEVMLPKTEMSLHALRDLVEDRKPHSWRELLELVGVKYCNSIALLRQLGYVIHCHRHSDPEGGVYTLLRKEARRERRIQLFLTQDQMRELLSADVSQELHNHLQAYLDAYQKPRNRHYFERRAERRTWLERPYAR